MINLLAIDIFILKGRWIQI